MQKNTVLSLVRYALTAGGSFVTSNGLATEDDTQALVGAIVTVVSILWAIFSRIQENKNTAASKSEGGFLNGNLLHTLAFLSAGILAVFISASCAGPGKLTPEGKQTVSDFALQGFGALAVQGAISGLKASPQDILAGTSAAYTALDGSALTQSQLEAIFSTFASEKTSDQYAAVSRVFIQYLLPYLRKYPAPDQAKQVVYGAQLYASIRLLIKSAVVVPSTAQAPLVAELRGQSGGLIFSF